MPYPVSPPALPPIVDMVVSESQDRSDADPFLSPNQAIQTRTEYPSQSEQDISEPDAGEIHSETSANRSVCLEESCNQSRSTISTPPPEAASFTAEELGAPLSVGGSGSLTPAELSLPRGSNSSSASHSSVISPVELVDTITPPVNRTSSSGAESPILQADPRFNTLLQMPDLEALIQGRTTQPRQSVRRTAHPNQTSLQRDELADQSQTAQSSTESELSNENLYQERLELEDSIRLDLPIPDPGASTEAEPVQQQIEPFEGSPLLEDEGSSAPTPLPAPSGGQVLTIPTPTRTRSDDSESEGSAPGNADSLEAEPPLEPPTIPDPINPDPTLSPTPEPASAPETDGSPAVDSPPEGSIPIDPQGVGEVLEVTADRQELDERQQVFRADGNVVVRFQQGELTADRVRVNLPNRVAVAEGDAILTRGSQVLRGERFTYNFGLNQGSIQTARGELFIPAAQQDFQPTPPTNIGSLDVTQPVTQRVSAVQPLQVQGGVPGLTFGVGDNQSGQGGTVNRLRFEAEEADFFGDSLIARNVRITNDPFSPPELELRSSRVTYNRLSPTRSEIRARNPRLVFDQGFSLPLLVNRLVLDSRQRDSGLLNFGFDEEDRDGFYIERSFDVYSSPLVYFSLTPQILVQRAIDQGGFPDPDHFGLVGNLDFQFTPTTTAQAVANLSSLDFEEIEDNLRASVRLRQLVYGHTVALDYSYRDRLFNGSLGFQDIQSSVGLVVFSPQYVLGTSGINLSYQGSVQYINAQTDERDLIPRDRTNQDLIEDIIPEGADVDDFLPPDPNRDLSCIDPDDRDTTGNGCADLTRYQAAVSLSRFFPLWYGTALPPTPTEGLRYTPTPILPYVGVSLEARGVTSAYSNGDTQLSLRGGVVLLGQFGNFSKPVFDYTSFLLGYFNTLRSGESPFLFDRIGDEQFVVAGLTQQIYGPLRFGVQVAYNLDTSDEIDTVYTLEYSRRTYSISATYSTGRESAALTFRLNDFNWTGDPGPFSGLGSSTVEGGLIQN